MATCLQGPPMSVAYTTSHLPKPQYSLGQRRGRSVGVALASLSSPSSSMTMPPFNPKDTFLSKVGFAAANFPEMLLECAESAEPDALPFLDLENGPEMMARPKTAKKPKRRSRKRRKDLATFLLSKRIVYLGMPLVLEVAELIIMQLMYLSLKDKKKPIYLYIDSTGTSQDDGALVASEYQGFAIYDALMQMKNQIYTVGLGFAYGHSCLLLAAGTKGKRYMLKHATAVIHEPSVVPFGFGQASDIEIRAKEAGHNRDLLVKLTARHTGKPVEVVAQSMEKGQRFDVEQAIEYGIVDKIYRPGKDHPLLMHKPKKAKSTTKLETLKSKFPGKWNFKVSEGQVS